VYDIITVACQLESCIPIQQITANELYIIVKIGVLQSFIVSWIQ